MGLVCVFSVVLILAAAGKFLYDETLENAETGNAYINRQAAAALNIFFSSLQSASTALLETVNRPGVNAVTERGDAVNSFFENNQHIAALAIYDPPDKNTQSLPFINHAFFNNNNIDQRLISIFIELNKVAPERERQTHGTVLNCESIFGFPLLAMVFPYRHGGDALVFFHLAGLEEVFRTGPHTSCIINTAGDVLFRSGRPLRPNGKNVFSQPYIQTMLAGRLNSGRLRYVNGDGRYTVGAYSMLNAVPVLFVTEITYSAVFGGLVEIAVRVGCVALIAVLFLFLTARSFTKSIRVSLKKLTEFDELSRKFQAASRFADMQLVRQSLDGLLPAEAEYKNATVLLSGMEPFSYIAERLNPDHAVGLLNKYINRAAGSVKKTNGTLGRFSDGNVRAHWGALSSTGSAEHDALNCIRCALMLRVAVYELNGERASQGERSLLKLSCGISSGEFTAGITDCGERVDYTLIGGWGDLAATAKSKNIVCNTDILITESTWHLVQKYVLVHEMPPLLIEGRPKPLRIFALINLRTRKGEAQVFPATLEDVQSLYLPEQYTGESQSANNEHIVPEF
ncbi:MAG: adenylate/guanylate cyclase domain-containing protein [Spirochaetaceae bacterium]|nr:adenylate/guanylate cyclase domain-containing protein [Spirochaetaceae bacterium]